MWKLLTPTCCCFSRSVVSNSLRPHGLQPTRLLCPWDSPGKTTGVGCHSLLQGIFPTQGSNPSLLHWQACSLPLSHLESPTWLCLKMTHQRCVLRNKHVWWTADLTSKYGNIKHSAPSARTSQLATNITNTRRAKQQPSIWQTCSCDSHPPGQVCSLHPEISGNLFIQPPRQMVSALRSTQTPQRAARCREDLLREQNTQICWSYATGKPCPFQAPHTFLPTHIHVPAPCFLVGGGDGHPTWPQCAAPGPWQAAHDRGNHINTLHTQFRNQQDPEENQQPISTLQSSQVFSKSSQILTAMET